MDQVAQRVRASNIELPAGGIKTDRGEILLRTSERRDWGTEFGTLNPQLDLAGLARRAHPDNSDGGG